MAPTRTVRFTYIHLPIHSHNITEHNTSIYLPTSPCVTERRSLAMADLEKSPVVAAASPKPSSPTTSETLSIDSDIPVLTPFQYRKLIWKLDLHLLPPLWALWFCSLIDRVNIGNAKIQGLEKDLHMDPKSNQFNVALVVIFIGLVSLEVPSNYLMKRVSPRAVLCAETLLLGEP